MANSSLKGQFDSFISRCEDELLVRYSNKGLFNRANKDISKGLTVTYHFDLLDKVKCELSDDTICYLTNSLDTWTCSCPSSQLCKHVLISILYYREHQLVEAILEEKDQTIDFSWLVTTPMTELLQPYTPTMIDEVAFRLRYDEQLEITASSLLTVKMVNRGMEVAYTPEQGKMLCALKEREGEIVKLEVLLRYRAHQGIDDSSALIARKGIVSFPAGFLQGGMELLTSIVCSGLSRLPEEITIQLDTMAVHARSADLPNIERGLHSIKTELELYFACHIRFSMVILLEKITETYLVLKALQQQSTLPVEHQLGAKDLAQLTGSFRSKYYEVPKLHLYGLGAEPWQSKSLYKGITYYFYSLGDGRIHTYTESRPIYYDDISFDYVKHYEAHSPWQLDLSLKQFSKSEVSFTGMKVNEEGRLSSSAIAKLSVFERQLVEDIQFGSYEHKSTATYNRGTITSLFTRKSPSFVLFRVLQISESSFNQRTQSLIMNVQLEDEQHVQFTIPFQSQWEKALKVLERATFYEKHRHFIAFVRIEDDLIYPISFLSGGHVTSLLLDL
ncbi:hypothetical protein J2Z32_002635 [Paenibacillus turicensis]|uniref:SWIM-type domain-containing protein n=1 Tax=Paenibacillus turicensis TaxID=160487 RepID=A0ABS4FTT2_9BACL|nr:hypothetical protein [Paenibacillus turicensis]MBP1905987.1 hypothetical protein [Paenibacillus turicensis]